MDNKNFTGREVKTALVLREVEQERNRQDAKWGQQDHDPIVWLAILMEEVGEASKEAVERRACELMFNWDRAHAKLKDYRHEMIQVAAVAVSMVECLDRNNYKQESFQDAVHADPDMTPEQKAKWLR